MMAQILYLAPLLLLVVVEEVTGTQARGAKAALVAVVPTLAVAAMQEAQEHPGKATQVGRAVHLLSPAAEVAAQVQ
jgi:hypothetical protein